ncbi:UDP-N-acetylglucosamine1-carboxyvinyltransferase [Denitrovibrio acetiphilus DSM 12809]|uniref:UDP-N-acetylglucosamine 1-carboxyvinyltransferase n=1 Tax=Denitrovibrio acetiphilus (strain DSM 12809 / NBRC 114555 / N2460) TaxID=522772 RepID=D4H337_DENA2|nr:UDP-N-acetylglucosamine 1-carboxyvinyltransferase [Denitrovibrio acetiphilus]ADD69060.1 UDP-N-acetylglucosamine1-carboxyvinyltransferase [Denitrovibrio acetiphilus DSM 12809]
MDKLVIDGGRPLKGSIRISGAKNAALPILAAVILADGEFKISEAPELVDINTMLKLLNELGISSKRDGRTVTLKSKFEPEKIEAPYELVKTMRASVLTLGPLVARKGRARVSLPGGCAIGERPVDLHLKALEAMGAEIKVEHGYVEAVCERLKGAEITFDIVTVTGTENIMMAATLAEGETVLRNAAQEPEVVDLARFLKKMGADIEGEGTKEIRIKGMNSLNSADYIVMPDRIEAGTFLCCVAGVGGEVELTNVPLLQMRTTLEKLKESGVKIEKINDTTLKVIKNKPLSATDITTLPYPGFPTDMQAQFMAVMACSEGVSVATETIFENRFMHVAELKRMGADIKLKDKSAIIKGVAKLTGAPVMASDLRASASLVIAALMAEGETTVSRLYHLDRGYENFVDKLNGVGAKLKRVKE